jgi:Protein of unknown function (DUF3122).
VGFPGAVELDRAQPLTLTTSLGQTLTARDVSREISQDTPALGNVGEYDIQLVLSQVTGDRDRVTNPRHGDPRVANNFCSLTNPKNPNR